jgi:Icc-related predicted phosphoesterase
MILLLGDIHGDIAVLKYAIDKAEALGASALVQVGDFGLFARDGLDTGFHRVCKNRTIPTYFIDGNHDDCSRWTQYTDVTQLWHDAMLFYVPRGTVMPLDNRTIAFLGGAGSIDKHLRLQYNWHWDERENISSEEVETLITNAKNKHIDMFITHCPPNSVIQQHFDPRNKLNFGVGLDWHDANQDVVEHVWATMKHPPIYSGHMHRSVVGKNYRIIDINETIEV